MPGPRAPVVASFSKTVPSSSSTKPSHRARAAALAFFERRVTFSLVISTFLFSSKNWVWVSRELLSDLQFFSLRECTSLRRRFALRFAAVGVASATSAWAISRSSLVAPPSAAIIIGTSGAFFWKPMTPLGIVKAQC
jgi:hypothetical protein